MVTTTTSPAVAASCAVAARACGPSSATRSARVSGPLLLLSTTSCPAAIASRATVLPMLPLPMKPQVVIRSSTAQCVGSFHGVRAGEAQREARSPLGGVPGLDGAAEHLRQPGDDGQTQPGADRAQTAVTLVQDRRLERDGEVVVAQARA